jgi:hypothetical protein
MCPKCGVPVANASVFRTTKKSQLSVSRCRTCHTVSHLSTNTIFQQCHLAPPQVVLLLRGVLKGEASITLAAALSLSPQTILNLRRDVQDSARFLQSKTPLTDDQTETDEMFQHAGEKVRNTRIQWIRRVVERTSNVGVEPTTLIVRRLEERLGGRAVMSVCALSRTRLAKPCKPRCIHSLTPKRLSPPTCSNGYHHIIRVHATVNQSVHECARDDDGDGMRARAWQHGGRHVDGCPHCSAPGRKAFTRNTWLVPWRLVSFDGI